MSFLLIVMALLMMMFLPMAFAGGATVLPTCKIKKGKKNLIVNASDAAAWVKKGWQRVDASDSSEDNDDGKFTLREAVEKARNKAVLEELVEAHEMEIDGFGYMTKAQQIDAILDYMDENDIE